MNFKVAIRLAIYLLLSGSLYAQTSPNDMAASTTSLTGPISQHSPQLFGGTLLRTTDGYPYIQFPEAQSSVFPNNDRSNRAWIVSFEGHSAIRIPAEHLGDAEAIEGNLIISKERVLFDPYLVLGGQYSYPHHGQYNAKKDTWQFAHDRAWFSLPRAEVRLRYPKYDLAREIRTTSFTAKPMLYNVGFRRPFDTWDAEKIALYSSPQMEQFVRDTILDFDIVMNSLLTAAGIADVSAQLGIRAQYQLVKESDFPMFAELFQRQLDHSAPPSQGGNGLATIVETLQIASAGATALQQSQAGGNTVAAQAAAKAQYDRTVGAIENGQPASISASAAATTTQPSSTPAITSTGAPQQSPFKIDQALVNESKAGKAPATSTNRPMPAPSSGTAASPIAVPSTGSSVVASNTALCPASGFVPGLMRQSGDTALGVPCTPGQPITIGGANAPSGSAGSSGGSGSGTATTTVSTASGLTPGFTTSLPIDNCVQQFYDNNNLSFINHCTQFAYVEWYVGTHSGSWNLAPEESVHSGYSSNDVATAGGSRYYACPKGSSPVDASYRRITSAVSGYTCRQF